MTVCPRNARGVTSSKGSEAERGCLDFLDEMSHRCTVGRQLSVAHKNERSARPTEPKQLHSGTPQDGIIAGQLEDRDTARLV